MIPIAIFNINKYIDERWDAAKRHPNARV
jgi:hypothetical protein